MFISGFLTLLMRMGWITKNKKREKVNVPPEPKQVTPKQTQVRNAIDKSFIWYATWHTFTFES